ncbi:hypothetical protein BJY16_002333 [Actinoplanes octamycinicus]|uniref:Uncharacterized protein n=1 Tax=Actinoplanes octamycinicus TaxID=135948 RepID=A0A7W7M6K0_9ACTN|nr:hypothetical protein [Actinoplanes octamycinicus]MBB4738874.1 hypothetical protein [Actinoplanes octamycinicus]
MLQLVGGVAVAGAVAAGSTAFTAGNGLASTPTAVVVGGELAAPITVSGATINTLTFTHAASPNSGTITAMNMALVKDDGTTAITTGTLTVTVTATGGTTTAFACTPGNPFVCDPAADWTGITAISAKYVEP